MTALQALGMIWLLLTAAIGHALIVVGALKFWRQVSDDATRGVVERQRDVAEMAKVREGLAK